MESIHNWLGPDAWPLVRAGLLQLGGALLILVFGLVLARWLGGLLHRVMRSANVESMLADFLRTLTRSVFSVLAVVAALDGVGVPAASLLAVLGAAGLAIGLALKDSLGNLAAGVMIILLKPFRHGHVIELSGLTGTVEQIRLMHTVLSTADNRELVFPNGVVINEPVINFSARDTRRLDLVLGIAYKDDIGRASEVIREVLARESRLLLEPAAQIVLLNLGESSVDLGIRPWVRTSDYWPVRSALLIDLKQSMDAAGISIPFPQRELHVIGQLPPAASAE
ncbi:MAG: mechanosensitive ion channel [Xanthomonadales bacterium]|nr:mechanosensitive ion channel [Xanthomonadales bacterium]